MIKRPRVIGTTGIQELHNLSADKPWEEVFSQYVPMPEIGTPNGFMFTQGSACASMATTSMLGHTYNSDFYLWRKDGTLINRDRYTTNTLDGNLVIYLMPKDQTSNHHIKLSDQIVKDLPAKWNQRIIENFPR
ncbi:hypothetical protein HY502_01660 [Candidatus Woesebacteria bacterium]|nr:hypothetical protein [Candidatus Woesebacteria bacterium]